MTGTDLEHRTPELPSLAARLEYADELAKSNLLPAAYRGKAENVLLAMEYGTALGVPPMTAIQGVHVIEGKPTLSADLMAALVRREGHKLRTGISRDGETRVGWAELVRGDDPDFTFRTEWTWQRATNAGLVGKAVWKRYPEAMLKARAVTEVIREGASEVLHGMAYTPEELGFDGTIVEGELVEETAPAPGGDTPAPSRHGEPEPVRKRDLTALHAAFGDLGIGKDDKHTYASSVIGREITSTKDLTRDEADQVIAQVRADIKARPDKNAADEEPVDAELVEDPEVDQRTDNTGDAFDDEAWKRGDDPRLDDPANDGALDAQMEADTDAP